MDFIAEAERPLIYDRLVREFTAIRADARNLEERWSWLVAAHVIGQHLLGRVPLGNVGRSTVGVTQVMEPPEAVQRLIDWALLAVRMPSFSRPA
jgi:hypothetical protein